MNLSVSIRRESVVLPTYEPARADVFPMFLENRVYQGSSGRVYPLPVVDRIASEPTPRAWQAVFIENRYLQVMILPELGGRIHRIIDKPSGRDLIYYQPVIKPALVGLAGPWVSGGIEFNWPQHHRPSTAMPAEVEAEDGEDGSRTVWLSEHDPVARMKGMHGVCLYPDEARLELRARVYNRTGDGQTFLWWANVGLEAHEQVQSFFPPDVTVVADHAKRAMSTFPLSTGHYYGVDYLARAKLGVPVAERPAQYPAGTGGVSYAVNDLSWYANIPVPTSYMAVGSQGDFCGAYDHRAGLGLVHVANHHVSPGKKQWTWGNHDFGYAWDRNLTNRREDGRFPPYIELMAGVYTDNQPDFSYLQPGETKVWRQSWFAVHGIGVPRHATEAGAIDLRAGEVAGTMNVRVAVTREWRDASIYLRDGGDKIVGRVKVSLAPGEPWIGEVRVRRGVAVEEGRIAVEVRSVTDELIIAYRPTLLAVGKTAALPEAAKAPVEPGAMASADELYLTGLHLEQYRHATRCPTAYWREALRRDPGDARCNLALGRWHLRRGEFGTAETHLQRSVARLTRLNPNPADGEAHYQLGRCWRHLGREDEAYAMFYKATWNQGWAGVAFHALAEIDATRGDWAVADEHLARAIALNADNLRARNLRAEGWWRAGLTDRAEAERRAILQRDPLDAWARWRRDGAFGGDNTMRLDVVHDLASAGLVNEALALLENATDAAADGTGPLVGYTRAWLGDRLGKRTLAKRARAAARSGSADWCFPARLEEAAVLTAAIVADETDARARTLLGHWLYDRKRHREAIAQWEQAVRHAPDDAVAWRCLGIGYFNILGDSRRARRAYEKAVNARPDEARLGYERDQLWKRMGVAPHRRRRALLAAGELVSRRDDLVVELAALHNQLGDPAAALALIASRKFQPWEGGEGEVSRQYGRARLLLGKAALARGAAREALAEFTAALTLPENLGEARHLLVNPSEVYWWLGEAYAALGERPMARVNWQAAAEFRGDFQGMRVRAFSESTVYSARALARLGRRTQAKALFRALLVHAEALAEAPAEIDYFATSLPTLLLFSDDLPARQRRGAQVMQAQARAGLGERDEARALVADVLRSDPSDAVAADLSRELSN